MNKHFQHIIETIEPLEDPLYGPRYRCSLTLNDGTYIPCAVIQSKHKFVKLAKRRIIEEMDGKSCFKGADPYGQILSSFVTGRNQINEYDVISATLSPFAIPLTLLHQIQGETTMAWTGWVFEMSDGCMFSYGSDFSMEFFQLPDGYSFLDVTRVHNHSYIGKNGNLLPLQKGGFLPDDYGHVPLLRKRVYFTCAIEGI